MTSPRFSGAAVEPFIGGSPLVGQAGRYIPLTTSYVGNQGIALEAKGNFAAWRKPPAGAFVASGKHSPPDKVAGSLPRLSGEKRGFPLEALLRLLRNWERAGLTCRVADGASIGRPWPWIFPENNGRAPRPHREIPFRL